jgi:hypothetical protein
MNGDKKDILLESGAVQFRHLLKHAGGTLSQDAVAARLGLSLADVERLTGEHRLLAIKLDGANEYPVWQFDETGVVTGLEQVLAELSGLSVVLQVTFFLSGDERMGVERIDYLRAQGPDSALLNQARQLGKQGAT